MAILEITNQMFPNMHFPAIYYNSADNIETANQMLPKFSLLLRIHGILHFITI